MNNENTTTTIDTTSLFDLCLRLITKQEKANEDVFASFEKELKEFLAKEENAEIRLFFGYSNDIGQRATSIWIMNRLISYFPDEARTIRIIYDIYPGEDADPDPSAQKRFARAMKVLIPRITVDDVIEAKTFDLTEKITLKFVSYDPSQEAPFDPPLPDDNCLFGISGGFNDTSNLTEALKVDQLIALAPYQFTKNSALNTIFTSEKTKEDDKDGTLLGPKYNYNGTEIEKDEEGKPITGYYGESFTRRAYYMPTPERVEEEWKIFEEASPEKYALLEEILALRKSTADPIEVMPLSYRTGRIVCTNRELLFNLTSGLFKMKRVRKDNHLKNTCSVVVVFDGPGYSTSGKPNKDFENFEKLISKGFASLPRLNARIASLRPFYKSNYSVVSTNDPEGTLETKVNEVGPDGIVIVNLGSVPLYVANYMGTAAADLPPVFEGEINAGMFLNSGKAFLHLVSSDLDTSGDDDMAEAAIDVNQLYPTIPLDAPASPIANKCHADALGMSINFSQWNALLQSKIPAPDEVIGNFLYEACTPDLDEGVFEYFKGLGDFFHKPENDKLMMGLMPALAKKEEGMTLKDLYEKVKEEDPLKLIPDVIAKGNIFNYFSEIVKDKTFVIDNPVVTTEKDEDDEITEIKITGTSDSYGLEKELPVTLVFTSEFDDLHLEFNGDMINEPMTLPGVSWFGISEVKVASKTYNADMPGTGTVGGRISVLPDIVFSMDYPVQANTWVFHALLESRPGLSTLVRLCKGDDIISSLPPPMKTFLDLGVDTVDVCYNSDTKTLEYISLSISSSTPWRILPMLALNKIGLEATIALPASAAKREVNYSITGNFQIGEEGTENGLVSVTASMPGLQISGGLESGSELYLRDLLRVFVKGIGTDGFDSRFTQFSFLADPTRSTYNISGTLEANWSLFSIGTYGVVLKEVSANFEYLNANTTGGISGVIELQAAKEGVDSAVLNVSAEHPEADAGWLFKGELADGGQIDVRSLLENFLGFAILPDGALITVNSLSASFNSKTKDYSFQVSVDWGNIFGPDIQINLSDTTLYIESEDGTRTGYITADASFAGVKMKFRYDFTNETGKQNKITFIIFDIKSTLTVGTPPYVLEVSPQNKSVGDIATFLVNAAAPGSGISLTAPWDVMNSISLDGFKFKVDFTGKTVGFTYPVNVNLGFVDITNIGLTYSFSTTGPSNVASKKIEVALEGSFLGQAMAPPWDMLKPDDAPKVPGKGNKEFELQFLGIGQRVGINMDSPSTVKEAVGNMMKAFKTPPQKEGVLVFDPSANWLVGTRFVILEMVNIDAVFYDPVLYGLGINVTGGKFEGLEFEILYKKVNDNIGVYQILLALPAYIRQMEFGALSITLPNVGVWIYTNGDFKLDFGFPANGNFDGSFGIQFLPFTGAGGFYFGMLSTQTAPQLPSDYNPKCGDFNPVIVFGIGLRMGIGKSINKGILKAELSLAIQGIIEGTLAFFNAYPAASQQLLTSGNAVALKDSNDRTLYYYVQGQISIVGRIYGEINFAIISASLEITVTLSVRAVIEAYQAMLVNFSANVSVSLSVSINLGLFSISIGMSFNATISESFTLGEYNPDSPWNCSRQLYSRRPQLLSLTEDRPCPEVPVKMNWQPVYTNEGAPPKPIELYFATQFTVTSDANLQTHNSTKNPRGVAMLYIRSSASAENDIPPFTVLSRGILTWVLNAFYNKDVSHPTEKDVLDTTILLTDLQDIYCYLSQDTFDGAAEPFTYEQLIGFLSNYFKFSVALPPEATTGGDTVQTGIFPMFPLLSLVTPKGITDFGNNASIQFTVDELTQIKNYFRQLAGRSNTQMLSGNEDPTTQSLAHYIFLDYFRMIAKAAVQDAIDKMNALPHEVSAKMDLAGLVGIYPESGISIGELAFANRLREINPGTKLRVNGAKHIVRKGDTHEKIARQYGFNDRNLLQSFSANKLIQGKALELPVFLHKAQKRDSLRNVASQYGLDVKEFALENHNVKGLFVPGKRILFPFVDKINAGQLLDLMVEQKVFDNISGLSARVMLQGLRPLSPADSVFKGLPTAFYNLSLQQFDATGMSENSVIALRITDENPLEWLTLDNGVNINFPVTIEVVKFITDLSTASFAPSLTGPSALPLARLRPKNFTLATQIAWDKPDAGQSDAVSPSIWPLSAELIQLLQSGKQPLPSLSLFVQVQETENSTPPPVPIPDPVWGMKLDVRLSRVPGADKTMYQLIGVGQADSSLLENLLTYHALIGGDVINGISVLYAPEPAKTGQTEPPTGLVSDAADEVSLFIAQANLSTVSHPPSLLFKAQNKLAHKGLVGQTEIEFLKLLWECSITGTGGFFLYYAASDGKTLPDFLFNDNPVASVTILVSLNVPNGIPGFVNTAVLNQTIDTAHEVLFAQASFEHTKGYTMSADETLHSLTEKFHININRIAKKNPGLQLTHLQNLRIPAHGYRLKKEDSLGSIAKHHGISVKELMNMNLQNSSWKPAHGTVITLPATQFTYHKPYALKSLARLFKTTKEAILHANRHVPGLIVSPLTFDNSIEEKISIAPAGSTGFTMDRQDPSLVTDPNQKQLLELYNLLEYKIANQGIFKGSNPAIPAGPSDDEMPKLHGIDRPFGPPALNADDWKYKSIFPVYPFVKTVAVVIDESLPNPADNPYLAIYGLVQQEVTISFSWNDIFGNTLNADADPSATWPDLSIPLGYTDAIIGLAQWRNMLPGYTVSSDGGTPSLNINFRFLADRYTGIADADARMKNAKTDMGLYQSIYFQLVQDDAKIAVATTMDAPILKATFTEDPKTTLLNYVGSIYSFLRQVADGGTDIPAPADIQISWAIADLNPANVFLFTVSLTITRELDLVSDEFKDELNCSTVTSIIKPDLEEKQKSDLLLEVKKPLSLAEFATDFQKAFPQLKVLTGPPANSKSDDEIWIARFSKSENGIWMGFTNPGTPNYYAVKPLSVNLLSNPSLPIYRYTTGQFIGSSPTAPKAFNSIDIELQGAAFLAAVDLFLSAKYVVNAWLAEVDAVAPGIDPCSTDSPYNTIINAKRDLAAAIASHLGPVFKDEVSNTSLAEAKKSLEQELLVQLSNAYSINTVVQFDACVQGNTGKPANLYGKPVDSNEGGSSNVPYALSTSKIAIPTTLENSCMQQDSGNQNLTFMFSATNPDVNPYMDLSLDYIISAMEVNISEVPGIDKYTASDWLSFVLPFKVTDLSTSLGNLSVPVPLRAYPTPPSVLSQEAISEKDQLLKSPVRTPLKDTEDLARAKEWTYSYTYDYRGAGQDTIDSRVVTNTVKNQMFFAKEGSDPDLFTALMQFSSAYPAIQADLNQFLLRKGDQHNALTALQSLAWLICRVAKAWKTWGNDSMMYARGLGGSNTYDFRIRQEEFKRPGAPADELPCLMVIVSSDNAGVSFPIINIDGYKATDPGINAIGSKSYIYVDEDGQFLSYEKGLSITKKTILLSQPFDIMQEENAIGGISIIRNLDLGGNREVSDDFIYRTPLISIINPSNPLLHPAIDINVAEFSDGNNPMNVFISNFMKQLFDKIDDGQLRRITFGASYSYELVARNSDPNHAMRVNVPVMLTTAYDFRISSDYNTDDDQSFVYKVAENLTGWFKMFEPNKEDGQFDFKVSVYSSLTDSNLPVLTLDMLYLKINVITDL
ncbi:LysM peptidoglycan-binding domain-containing protein [Flavobacterium pallidum]|uniref:LysM domain-containing protein n=1 Tax=Flavobacterium pallidum TaxID=2172098 RepID=A0A2S1SFU3_9FLAO|nr:LysM peptidoglycan-binding domain-containing protein [Flavobacterium pallidum]AWI25241.1 hypothetical protein HYN49_04655 [Flavobacterium pallidum]